MSIYEKHARIVQSLDVPKVHRVNDNKFVTRLLPDLLEALKPLMKKNKVTIIFNDTREIIDGRCYIKAEATMIDTEDIEQPIISAESSSSEHVAVMSPIDFARYNALCALFFLDTSFDEVSKLEDAASKFSDSGIPFEVK